MSLPPGKQLGPYTVIAAIGAGGMGEVYRAIDTRLDRTVAIKILRDSFVQSEMRQRFEREARTISKINHPNICILYDIGQEDGVDYLVMEYLEGETLSDRLQKGALPLDQIFRYGTEICKALFIAHKNGIVHRDLKPGNIMITKSGVKLLDFGLAKIREPESGASNVFTKTNLTEEGAVPGTPAYMAPEQLEGQRADARSDIFALGTVLFEMSTGKRPFENAGLGSLISAILKEDPPPPSSLNSSLSPGFDRLIALCLSKDPDERWQSPYDMALEMKRISGAQSGDRPKSDSSGAQKWKWISWALASVLLLLSLLLFRAQFWQKPLADAQVTRFTIPPPANNRFEGSIAVSPDGKQIAFAAIDADGNQMLWIRPLDAEKATTLPGSEEAIYPFWSPDSRSVGFFTNRSLKTMELATGSAQTLCAVADSRGGTWNQRGMILFAAEAGGTLYRISSRGGSPAVVATIRPSQTSIRFPYFLPDGDHFLFYMLKADARSGVSAGSLRTVADTLLVSGESGGIYSETGHLVFQHDTSLYAQTLDEKRLLLSGEPLMLSEKSWISGWIPGVTAFSASRNGVLAYRTGGLQKYQFALFDRSGKLLKPIGPEGVLAEPSLSPDEKRVSLSYVSSANGFQADVWILELLRGNFIRLTTGPAMSVNSLWSPDGNSIVYTSYPGGGLYQRSLEQNSSVTLWKTESFAGPEDWSKDGRWLVFSTIDFTTNKSDLWLLPMTGNDRKATPWLQTRFNEASGQISPDSKWILYASDESGKFEIYLNSFPVSGQKIQISNAGGEQPRWRGDGKEVFYISPDKKVVSVELNFGETLEPGTPRILFQTQIVPMIEARNHWDVTADGQTFLINTTSPSTAEAPIEVITNWTSLLK